MAQQDERSPRPVGRVVKAVVLGVVRSSVLAGCALLVPAAVALLPVLAAFGLLGSPWSWANPWSWIGLVLIGVSVTLALAHPVAAMFRTLILRWTSVRIGAGFRTLPEPVKLATGHWWNGISYERSREDALRDQRVQRVGEPAYWREVRWVMISAITVGLVCSIPGAALSAAVVLFISASGVAVAAGVCLLAAGLLAGTWAWRIATPLAQRWLAGPGPSTEELHQRADLSAAHDAEIRRIERDLHDGAQARLVAVGLDLAVAERLMETDPERARTVLRAAREGTRTSLNELRDLVRGVYPPVLIERGLVPAIRAAALDSALDVTVTGDDTLRPPSPVAAALYFATCELLANVAKHARIGGATVTIASDAASVAITVRDTGAGGARLREAGGLDGVRRRLDAFGGALEICSPVGGPTVITARVPCESF